MVGTVYCDDACPTTPAQPIQVTKKEQVMHVLEVKVNTAPNTSAPPLLVKFFMDGGDSLKLDPFDIVTQNWIISQLAGGGATIYDNQAWIKELKGRKFVIERVVHANGARLYMLFEQSATLGEMIYAAKTSTVGKTHVIKITAGAGDTRQTWGAARGAMNDSVKVFAKEEGRVVIKGGGIAVLFTMAMDTAEWYKDYSQIGADGKPKKDFTDLFSKIGIDLLKAGLSAAIASAVVSVGVVAFTAVAALVGTTVVVPMAVIVVGVLVVAVVVGFALDYVDKQIGKSLGKDDTVAYLSGRLKATTQYLGEKFSKEVLYKNYYQLFEPIDKSLAVNGR
jgi:hypothetical protein